MRGIGESRFFYYMIVLNMLVTMFLVVPYSVIQHRFEGALFSMGLASLIGVGLLFVFMRSLNRFPGQDVTAILTPHFRKGIRSIILLFVGLLMTIWGLVVLLLLAQLITMYLNHQLPLAFTAALISFFVVLAMYSRLSSLLYSLEIVLLLMAPLLIIIFSKTFYNKNMNVHAILEIGTHLNSSPAWSVVGAAYAVFSGFVYMLVFNGYFKKRISLTPLWVTALGGLLALAMSLAVPVGLHGTYNVAHFLFPWAAATDSMYMEFFIIERVIFLFLPLLIMLALMNAVLAAFVGFTLVKTVIPAKQTLFIAGFGGIFVLLAVLASINLNQYQTMDLAVLWLNIRLPCEILLVLLLFYTARRKRTG
ncbi:hypothetical protein M3202_04280 [Alkalihalobacillus oceani]|uniref:Spore germination protein n=1 Tax=Halalkalibacter oceani TaxID=1653776 RepID=A0A9X2DQ24_9BACI|nr:hypothetical protein [Halalkalibacter oceani]MCM3713292.1 hypothetical protein [Halalkalibacter oceani]